MNNRDFEEWFMKEIADDEGDYNKPVYEAAKWAWQEQQTKIDELQARVDSLTNINESLVAYKNQLLDEIEEKGNKNEN